MIDTRLNQVKQIKIQKYDIVSLHRGTSPPNLAFASYEEQTKYSPQLIIRTEREWVLRVWWMPR